MVKYCETCKDKRAFIVRPKTGKLICQECFFTAFEEEIHYTIISNNLFKRGERIAMGASGGKDSTVLIHVMSHLNKKYDYGLELILLSIDEGITGYRDDSLETVKDNQHTYGLQLKILSYKDLYGWTMDEIVKHIGLNNNCTYCGVFRRQALDRGLIKKETNCQIALLDQYQLLNAILIIDQADKINKFNKLLNYNNYIIKIGAQMLKCDKILTGHNADDIAETILMNIARGDFFRLGRCVQITTGSDGGDDDDHIPRIKPFKYTYEKEIVLYAYHKKLVYFSTECIYSPNAYRGHVRELIKDIEKVRPSTIVDIIHSAEQIAINVNVRLPKKMKCTQCGFVSSNEICKACVLLDKLNKGKPKVTLKAE